MNYYCNECKTSITEEEFYYSMNKYKKALCKQHQSIDLKLKGSTKDLQSFIKKRHTQQRYEKNSEMKSIKDWINADIKTWEKVIKKQNNEKK
jgi:hypothetical protein